jgi:hypothetical protein
MSYEPRGKVSLLIDAMRAPDAAAVWSSAECAALMDVVQGGLPAYLKAAIDHCIIHKKVDNGRSFFSLKPFGDVAPGKLHIPQFGASNWSPPKMQPPRGATGQAPSLGLKELPLHEVLQPVVPKGKSEIKSAAMQATIQADMEPRADRGNRLLLDKLKTTLPHWDGAPSRTPAPAEPEPVVAQVPIAEASAKEEVTDDPVEATEDDSEPEPFNAALWADGDLVLYGLPELEDGGRMVAAEHVAALKRLLGVTA